MKTLHEMVGLELPLTVEAFRTAVAERTPERMHMVR